MNAKISAEPAVINDYVGEPFAAEWGTWEWVDEATARYDQALNDYARAASRFASATVGVEELFGLRLSLYRAIDLLLRAKWMQREVVKMVERLPPREGRWITHIPHSHDATLFEVTCCRCRRPMTVRLSHYQAEYALGIFTCGECAKEGK